MAEECELLQRCGFFEKYSKTKDVACRGLIKVYCRGEKMNQCKRKEYSKEHGQSPSIDMMPNGYDMVQ